jgi:hypothetical protein
MSFWFGAGTITDADADAVAVAGTLVVVDSVLLYDTVATRDEASV